MGFLVLEGGAEFGGAMREADLRAMQLAGGPDAPICIIPTAAAPDHNHQRAGMNGIRWFESLGASNVFSAGIIDVKSANDSKLADVIRLSSMFFLLGGFPRYLEETLRDSHCWRVAMRAFKNGAVMAGSSAGAMVLCEYYFDPQEQKVLPGLNLIPNTCILPHHNTFGKSWAARIRAVLPDATLLGIDESTGMINNAGDEWQVYGSGRVTVYGPGQVQAYERGGTFSLQ